MGQLKRHDDLPSTPWTQILTSVPVLAYIIAQVISFINDMIFAMFSNDFVFIAGWAGLGILYHGK